MSLALSCLIVSSQNAQLIARPQQYHLAANLKVYALEHLNLLVIHSILDVGERTCKHRG